MKRRPEVGCTLPSLSLDQLARRWAWEESDVADAIQTGVLRAHLLLHRFDGTVGTGSASRTVQLSGHYPLPTESAAELLGFGTITLGAVVEVLLDDAGTRASVGFSFMGVDRQQIRVMAEEVARFEDEGMGPAPTPRASGRESVRHRERFRSLAAYLWRRDPSLTIEDVIRAPELGEIALDDQTYGSKTLRDWIKDLCPNRSPGRRKTPANGD
jgi:hypothetical protein